MTEQTADDALVELARVMCAAAWSDTDEGWNDASDDQRAEFIRAARAILPILTRRERDTWKRAIEAAADMADRWNTGIGDEIRDMAEPASLKDQGHG